MKYLINLYKTNTLFHSFVAGLEGAVVASLVAYSDGFPTTKTAFVSTAAFFGKALWGWFRGYLTGAVVPTLTK
jgi:hypothetical protein